MKALALGVFALIGVLVGSQSAWAGVGETSFTPISLLVPIRRVLISDNPGGPSIKNATLFQCSSASLSDCAIDVADSNQLKSFFQGAPAVKEGNYTGISISNCTDEEGGYSVRVKGTLNLSGVTYYTTANGSILSVNSADLGYVTVPFTGCQKDTFFPTMLTVTKDSVLDVSLILSIREIAHARLSGASGEGCRETPDHARSVCVSYPNVAPYLGTTVPTLQVYDVYEGSNAVDTAGGRLLFLFDSAARYIGGFTRPLFSETSIAARGNFGTDIKRFQRNGNSTYLVTNIGSTFSQEYTRFPEFELSDHSGYYETHNGESILYHAIQR